MFIRVLLFWSFRSVSGGAVVLGKLSVHAPEAHLQYLSNPGTKAAHSGIECLL